jgi:hypothetical protein
LTKFNFYGIILVKEKVTLKTRKDLIMSVFAWISLISVIFGVFFLYAFLLNDDCCIKHRVFGVLLTICFAAMVVNIPLAIIDKTNGQKETWTQQEIVVSKWAETEGRGEDRFFLGTDSGIDFKVSGRTYGAYEKGDEVKVKYERTYGKFSNYLYEEVKIKEGE